MNKLFFIFFIFMVFFIFFINTVPVNSKEIISFLKNPTLPKKQSIITPEEIKLMNKEILDIALKRLDDTILIFSVLITIIISFVTFFNSFLILKERKNSEIFYNQLKENINEQLKNFNTNIDMNNKINELKENLDTHIKKWIEERFRKEIHCIARSYAEESLMLIPKSRDFLISILRDMVRQLKEILKDEIKEENLSQLIEILNVTIQKYHIIFQIFHPNLEEVKKGMQTLAIFPIPELYDYLKRFELRYENDPEILSYIKRAKKSIEDYIIEKK